MLRTAGILVWYAQGPEPLNPACAHSNLASNGWGSMLKRTPSRDRIRTTLLCTAFDSASAAVVQVEPLAQVYN